MPLFVEMISSGFSYKILSFCKVDITIFTFWELFSSWIFPCRGIVIFLQCQLVKTLIYGQLQKIIKVKLK